MSLNGKRDHFELSDLIQFGVFCDLKPKKAKGIIREMHLQIGKWSTFAEKAGVPEKTAQAIYRAMRRKIIIPV
ncbi:MAG: hypothetical protein BGP00_21300 [Novosphingobium sp. 63-713]|uniref:hypothetical protein n=1 Tax=unclassified Novosphingobium TaxID=2644732 RepID=UPI0009609CFE|nr:MULTISPECIES: hypothetical protein [unclassified Novosphingobium]MBN9142326.1 hypothetical protein [Novosphingobium sp.]OJX90136.1 MAG: hypothetical protein BGP00_21300 [Novosphingobium sp. 63-713]